MEAFEVHAEWEADERQLDRGVVAGAILALVLLGVGMIGGNAGAAVFLDPASLFIVLGGTLAATLVHFPIYDLVESRQALRHILFCRSHHPTDRIDTIVRLAHSVRNHGLLSLEREAKITYDPFFRRALEITVDGQQSEDVKRILETEIRSASDRASRAVQVFQTMGGYAPAMGLIGTIVGLVRMLGALASPETIGPAMAMALITTLYGALLANLVFLPVAGKIKNRSEEALLVKQITTEGVLSLGRQENPIVVEQRLQSFLPLTLKS